MLCRAQCLNFQFRIQKLINTEFKVQFQERMQDARNQLPKSTRQDHLLFFERAEKRFVKEISFGVERILKAIAEGTAGMDAKHFFEFKVNGELMFWNECAKTLIDQIIDIEFNMDHAEKKTIGWRT